MARLNMNSFARAVTLQEGKRKQISIGQVKEVIRLTLVRLAQLSDEQIVATVRRYEGKPGVRENGGNGGT